MENKTWKEIKETIASNNETKTAKYWLNQVSFSKFENMVFHFSVPSVFVKDSFEKKFGQALEKELALRGICKKYQLTVDEDLLKKNLSKTQEQKDSFLNKDDGSKNKEKLEEMGIPQIQFPDLTKLFPPASPNGETCTDCDSDKCKECNAWDVGCELSHMLAGTCTPTGNGNGEPTPTCTTCDSDKCQECNAWDIPCELGHMASGTCTPPVTPPTPTCECEACKNGTGECSDKKPCCNAWDILCEMGGECSKPPKPNECGCLPFDIGCELGCWWDKNKNYVYIIGGIIGLGILLWLLRPLFGIAKNITET